MVEIWPKLPIIVQDYYAEKFQLQGVNNVLEALRLNDRILDINLQLISIPLLTALATINEPFKALTSLELRTTDENAPALPESFLGGSAPRLRELSLDGIPSPAVSKLLSSAKDLVSLRLWNIPNSGYIPPNEMVKSLSKLTKLKTFYLGFRSPRSETDREHESPRPPPLKRDVLPALTAFFFKGSSEYLEETVARIDVPLLRNTSVTLFNQLIYETPQLRQFIVRTSRSAPQRVDVVFSGYRVQVILFHQNGEDYHKTLELAVSCAASDWQLSSLAHICLESLPPLPTLERLGIHEGRSSQPVWQDDVDHGQWVELFHPFTSVNTLDISETFVGRIAPALQVLASKERAEVLPALQNIFLEGLQPPGLIQDAIGRFVAARQLSGHQVAVHHRDRGRWWHKRAEDY